MATPTERGKRGPARKQLDSSQGTQLFELLRSGYGRKLACFKVGIGYRRFLRQLRSDRDFADCVLIAEAMRSESCEYRLYRLVMDPCDTPLKLRALIAYLARRDKIDEARRARREKARDGLGKTAKA
jgi:hypothetical protein